tara:strand:+ start:5160 stop:5345 length:186 start_codon:yes stop_codon:yes gene_type:complete
MAIMKQQKQEFSPMYELIGDNQGYTGFLKALLRLRAYIAYHLRSKTPGQCAVDAITWADGY